MFPWSAILGVAGLAYSGISSAINNKRAQEKADAEYEREKAAAQARSVENPMARADVQQAVHQYDRDSQQQIENAQNRDVITGSNTAQAVQKSVAEGRANLIGGVAADSTARADKYNDEIELINRQKAADDQARLAARQQSYAALASNAVQAAASIADSYGAGGKVKKMDGKKETGMPSPNSKFKVDAYDYAKKNVGYHGRTII